MKHRLKFLMKLAVWTSVAMCLINKFIESSSIVRHLLNVQKGSFFDWRHGKVYYTKQGSGSPVLLLHDFSPVSSGREWTNVIDSLSESHTVYTLDLLGCGRSDKPGITYSNYLFVELISEFIEDVIREKASVMATGRSGSFVVMAAKTHPDLFDDLILVNPESFGKLSVLPNTRSKITKAILDCPILGVSLYYLLTCRSQVDYEFTEKYFCNPFKVTDKDVLTYYESAHLSGGRGRHVLASLVGNYVNFDIRSAVKDLPHSVRLIFGSQQPLAQKIADAYTGLNPSITCCYVKNTKALPQMEAPEEFLKQLL